MRIVAGNSKINILSENQNNSDFIVLAELVKSSMGYEKPILVRNSRDLLIWFGDEFEEYNYFRELLELDKVSLYLFRSIETTGASMNIDNRYYYIPDVSPNTQETLDALEDHTCFWIEGAEHNENLLPEVGEEGKLYKVIRRDGINYDSTYNIRYSYYQYNSDSGSYLLYSSLDKNKDIKSLQNRDRLSVGYFKNSTYDQNTGSLKEGESIQVYSYFNPGIDDDSYDRSNQFSSLEKKEDIIDNFDELQRQILSGIVTRHLEISKGNISEETLSSDPNIPLVEGEYVLPMIDTSGDGVQDTSITYFYLVPDQMDFADYYENGISQSSASTNCLVPSDVEPSSENQYSVGLATENFQHSYGSVNVGGTSSEGETISGFHYEDLCSLEDTTYDFPIEGAFLKYEQFYNMPEGFKIGPKDFLLDQQDIYDFYVLDQGEVYRFESKTIGKGSEDIKVEVRWIETYTEKNNTYSVTISRYDYQEFFEGPLEYEFGVERLDHQISRESKLIRFKIIPQSEPEEGWPEGEWELKGAYEEKSKDIDYSFSYLCKNLEDFPPDFVLIPKKEQAPSEYRVLDWIRALNCQALITNTSEDWRGNIEDRENRLMYFYNSIEVREEIVPGYYVFLKGLLHADSYLPSIIKLSYEFPEDIYEEDEEDRESKIETLYNSLEEKKSNYLSCNNHYYFYSYYFPGENYITTPLVRFVVSKITRELEKNKWEIIGKKEDQISEESLYPILQAIQNRFSIIRSIDVNNFVVDGISRTVEASITTMLSDIISSDVSFDIILNYSKLNN